MRSYSPLPDIERARPLLGTLVAVRVDGASAMRAHRAIDLAFSELAEIHALMSFQEAASDVSRMNRDAARQPVVVHAHTFRVLRWAERMARLSDGIFDVSVAGRLIEWSLLPCPQGTRAAAHASFRDITLMPGRRVHFKQPLWIDLSGIAKGYAVDCAIAVLRRAGIRRGCVNAGGDLRMLGKQAECVALRAAVRAPGALPMVEMHGGALATSSGEATRRGSAHGWVSSHVAGHTRSAIDARTTVSVLASRCVVADALTKVVLADRERSAPILKYFAAGAYVHHPDLPGSGWQALGALQ